MSEHDKASTPTGDRIGGLHWEVHEGNGPHMLMVHGFLSSRSQWRDNIESLREVCTPVIAELWGHGRSPRGATPEHYHPEGYSRQFEIIREALGIERWFVCGQSLGASLTLRYGLDNPNRIIAQVFTNSNSALSDATQIKQRQIDAADAIEDIKQRGLAGVEALRVHPKNAKRLPRAVHREMVEDAGRIDPMAIVDSYLHLNVRSTVRDRAHEISVPTMLVCGHYESRFADAREFAAATIPGIEVVDLPAGHAVNAEAVDGFNQSVGQFLRAHLPY
jgi:pimeloyl-ACP methyl ester carboxylesterase